MHMYLEINSLHFNICIQKLLKAYEKLWVFNFLAQLIPAARCESKAKEIKVVAKDLWEVETNEICKEQNFVKVEVR